MPRNREVKYSKPRLRVCQPKQMYHPDWPRMGWTVNILDAKGLLFARVYGNTEAQVKQRAEILMQASHA